MEWMSDLTPEGRKYFMNLEKLAAYTLKVGFPEGSGGYEDGVTYAQVAAYNELGTSTIPSRPFMKQSWENHPDVVEGICAQAKAVLDGGGDAQTVLNMIGTGLKGLMQQEIVSGNFVPNAPSTIRKKGSATPLVDTGAMRQSVQYKIEGG